MPDTRGIGRVYFHTMPWPKTAPWKDEANTREYEPPYRVGKGVTIRFWPGKALILGKWIATDPVSNSKIREELEGRYFIVQPEKLRNW